MTELPSIADLADYAASVLSDIMDTEGMTDLELIQNQFKSSDCDNFAYALHVLMGWQLVAVTTEKGPVHRLVQSPLDDGNRLIDVMGYTTESALKKRYKSKSIFISLVDKLPGLCIDEDEDLMPVIAAMTYLPYAPFANGEVSQAVKVRLHGASSENPN